MCLHRKLAKSTLVLVLVFGIHYIIFVGMPHTFEGPSWEVRMYCELFFNSFQVMHAIHQVFRICPVCYLQQSKEH